MRVAKCFSGRQVLALCLLLATAGPVQAGRGLLLNAYGAEALAMGGADVAVARDTNAINNNPAGLTQIKDGAFDVQIYPYYALFNHSDSLGNDEATDDPAGSLLAGGYAWRLSAWPNWVAGIGLYTQGGSGIGHSDLLTKFGNRDEVSANIGVSKLASAVAWQARDNLSIGLTLGLSYAMGRQKYFFNTSDTSDPNQPFFGLRFDGGTALSANVLIGIQYQPRANWNLAVVYTSKTDLSLTGGTATLNFESIGLGKVRYANARLQGLAFPQEIDVGLSWKPRPRWLLSVEFNWLDFSRALDSTRFRADSPSNDAASLQIDVTTPLRWRDQYVYAAGVAYSLSEKTTLRAGFNVENNPIRGEFATPALNLGQEREIVIGFGRKLGGGWSLDSALEYQIPVTHRYTNSALPLGDQVQDRYGLLAVVLAISRRW